MKHFLMMMYLALVIWLFALVSADVLPPTWKPGDPRPHHDYSRNWGGYGIQEEEEPTHADLFDANWPLCLPQGEQDQDKKTQEGRRGKRKKNVRSTGT